MKVLALVSLLFIGTQGSAFAKTWERCDMVTRDGSAKVLMSSFVHESYEKEYLIDYSIQGSVRVGKRIPVLIERTSTYIRYTNQKEQFNLTIELTGCQDGICPALLRTSKVDFENLGARCEFNISYTPATGSGGRCGGRRC